MSDESSRPTPSLVGAILVALVGLVWLGQGLGLIGGSVMSNDPKWAWIGGAMVLGAVAMVVRARRST